MTDAPTPALTLREIEAELTERISSARLNASVGENMWGPQSAKTFEHDIRFYEAIRAALGAIPSAAPAWQSMDVVPPFNQHVLLVETIEPSRSELHLHPDAKPVTRVTAGKWIAITDSGKEWVRYGIGNIAERRLSAWAPWPDPPVGASPRPPGLERKIG